MKKLIILLGAGLLLSCASENEQKGLDDIAKNFNAKTSYSKSFNTNNGITKNSFNIRVSESEMLDSINPAFSSGAIALMGFKNFTAQEKEKYSEVNVALVNSKQDTSSLTFTKSVLKLLIEKDAEFNRFSKALLNRDTVTLEEIVDPTSFEKGHSENIIRAITNIEKQHGALTGFIPSSISQSKYALGTMISYGGLLQFGKESIFYTCNFDDQEGKNKVVGYRIEPKP